MGVGAHVCACTRPPLLCVGITTPIGAGNLSTLGGMEKLARSSAGPSSQKSTGCEFRGVPVTIASSLSMCVHTCVHVHVPFLSHLQATGSEEGVQGPHPNTVK